MHMTETTMTDRETRAARNQQNSLAAFLAKKAEFDALLADLQQMSADHFGADPEAVLWGSVGDLAHWNSRLREVTDAYFNQRYDLADAVDVLRAALASKALRKPGVPRKPREGTKQEAVLAMLRRPEGATVAQVAEAMGWATHTVRGFFAGLKTKGHTVEVLERIRQVGPNREGARGSYTIYRVEG